MVIGDGVISNRDIVSNEISDVAAASLVDQYWSRRSQEANFQYHFLKFVSRSTSEKSRKRDLRLGFELLHNVEEVIIHLRLVAKLQFHLVQVTERVLNFQPLELLLLLLLLLLALYLCLQKTRINRG